MASAEEHKICVDPGHGGDPPQGDWGTYNELCKEKDLNFDVASDLFSYWLMEYPDFRNSVMTRYGDYPVTKADRIRSGTDAGAHAFISIHHNASDTLLDREYTKVFYSDQGYQSCCWWDARDLASLTADNIYYFLTEDYGYNNMGAENSDWPILVENPTAPAILGEAAFMAYGDHHATIIGTDLCLDYNNTVWYEAEGYWGGIYDHYYATAVGTSFSADPWTGDPSYILLTWEESDPPTWYHTYTLYRADICYGPYGPALVEIGRWDACCTTDSVHYSYVDMLDPSYERPYYYKLVVDGSGETVYDWTTPLGLTPNPPGPPANLVAVGQYGGSGTTGTVDLDWCVADPPGGPTDGFRVYRCLLVSQWNCGFNVQYRGTTTGVEFTDVDVPIEASIFYRVLAYNESAISGFSNEAESSIPVTGAGFQSASTPTELTVRALGSPGRAMSFAVAVPTHGFCTLEVFNSLGQKVAEPWAEHVVPGVHRVLWDGRGIRGGGVASGIYFVRVSTLAGGSATTKVVLIR